MSAEQSNDVKPKRYRPNVAAIILSSTYPSEYRFFIAHRTDIKGAWQFPQGGIDEGESPRDALLRELEEEIGTNDVEIISECPEWVQYDFPNTMPKKMYKGYDGQRQKYFLVRIKDESKINLQTDIPEFDKYQFVSIDEIFQYVTYFKRDTYKKILDYFKKEGCI